MCLRARVAKTSCTLPSYGTERSKAFPLRLPGDRSLRKRHQVRTASVLLLGLDGGLVYECHKLVSRLSSPGYSPQNCCRVVPTMTLRLARSFRLLTISVGWMFEGWASSASACTKSKGKHCRHSCDRQSHGVSPDADSVVRLLARCRISLLFYG